MRGPVLPLWCRNLPALPIAGAMLPTQDRCFDRVVQSFCSVLENSTGEWKGPLSTLLHHFLLTFCVSKETQKKKTINGSLRTIFSVPNRMRLSCSLIACGTGNEMAQACHVLSTCPLGSICSRSTCCKDYSRGEQTECLADAGLLLLLCRLQHCSPGRSNF